MSLLMVLVAAPTNSFVVVVLLATVVLLRAGAVTLLLIAVTTVPQTLALVVLPATSPLTANVALMARFVLTLALETAALRAAGVETRPSIAVRDVRRGSATVP